MADQVSFLGLRVRHTTLSLQGFGFSVCLGLAGSQGCRGLAFRLSRLQGLGCRVIKMVSGILAGYSPSPMLNLEP